MSKFPKEKTEAYYIYENNVLKVYISKKWIDREAYSTPTQVATIRVKKVFTGKTFKEMDKIVIDYPEQLIYSERQVIKEVLS